MFLWESGWTLPAIARRMQRTPIGCYQRAVGLGLKVGAPDGYEKIEHAARRTGFVAKTLLRVLAIAGVKLHLGLSDPTIKHKYKGGMYRHHYVETEAVDAAISAWLLTEPIAAAARSRGMSDDTLRRWLNKCGWIEPNEMGKNGHRRRVPRRLESAIIDRAAAAYLGGRIDVDNRAIARLQRKLDRLVQIRDARVEQRERLRAALGEVVVDNARSAA